MAISFDTAITNNTGGRTTTRSQNFTVGSGSDRILICTVQVENGFTISSVTYNSLALTLLGSSSQTIGTFNNTYFFYLINPPTGIHTLTITASGLAFTYMQAMSYFGVDQSNPFDGSLVTNRANSVTSITGGVTSTVDNVWLVGMGQAQSTGNPMTGGTNTTRHNTTNTTYLNWNIGIDTNAPQSPAGTHSMTVTKGGPSNMGIILAAMQPNVGGGGGANNQAGYLVWL